MSVTIVRAPWSCIARGLRHDSVEHVRLYLDFDRICGGGGDATKRRRGGDTGTRRRRGDAGNRRRGRDAAKRAGRSREGDKGRGEGTGGGGRSLKGTKRSGKGPKGGGGWSGQGRRAGRDRRALG